MSSVRVIGGIVSTPPIDQGLIDTINAGRINDPMLSKNRLENSRRFVALVVVAG